jgi:hypothetical protein
MIRRIQAPTEEQLAEAEADIERKRLEREFDERRQALQDARPKGAAKLSRTRAFGASAPPLNRGPMGIEHEPNSQFSAENPNPNEHRLSTYDRARLLGPPPVLVDTSKPTPKQKKSRFDVPDQKTASTLLKAMGVLYVEERKKNPLEAYQNLRDSIMINLDVLLPAMPQIKQMFELLQIGEPEKPKGDGNGKADRIETLTGGLRRFLQGDDDV